MIHLSQRHYLLVLEPAHGVDCPRCGEENGKYLEEGHCYRLFFVFPFLSLRRRQLLCKSCRSIIPFKELPALARAQVQHLLECSVPLTALQKIDVVLQLALLLGGVCLPLVPLWAGIGLWSSYGRTFAEPARSATRFAILLAIATQLTVGGYLLYRKLA